MDKYYFLKEINPMTTRTTLDAIVEASYRALRSSAIWLKNETVNELFKKAKEIRITPDGVVEMCFKKHIIIGFTTGKLFSSDGENCYVKVDHVYPDVYISSPDEERDCIVL